MFATKRIFFLIIFIYQFNQITAQETVFESFDEIQTKINELEAEGNFEGTIEFINSIRNQYPDNEFECLIDLVYCNQNLGRLDECMNIWEEGHSKGYFFLIRSNSPSYQDIKDDERFISIREEDNKLRRAALEESNTIYEVKLPADYSPDNNYPAMIVLHGGGRNINSPKPRWKSPTLDEKFIIVYIQSYLHYGSKSFGWANSDPRAENDIKNIYYEVVEEYSVDSNKVFLGGISAGGSVTFDLAIKNRVIPLNSIIAVCPAIAGKDFTKEQVAKFKDSGIKINIITGEEDWGLERQKEVMAKLDEAGAEYNVTIIPEMGHEYPDDFSERLEQILSDIE